MIQIDKEKLKKLSERERLYLDIIMSGLSLYLRGKPGTAKSAVGVSISNKMDIKYVDKRLSQIDETDIGLYPVLDDAYKKLEKLGKLKEYGFLSEEEFEDLKKPILENIKSGQVDILHFAIPDWAFSANVEPTIIHLEELNRCNIHVRNASLQLLNERQIGDLKLNDNVLLMSSGNLGEEDGTEVDEMDLALSNRLVILDHDMPLEEWIKEYAEKNVWSIVIDYLRAYPAEYYKLPNEKEIRYATPRSWTNLSKLITYKYGMKPKIKDEVIPLLIKVGKGFIGDSIVAFLRYCQDISSININDILNDWNNIKYQVIKFNRARISELISNLRYIDLKDLNNEQLDNLLKFLNSLKGNDDELTSYLLFLMDHTNENNFVHNNKIFSHFKEKIKTLREYTSRNLSKI